MKKMLVISAMIASLIAVAGPKADMEKANTLINQNKKAEAIKLLKTTKATKGEEIEFETINEYLANNAETEAEAIGYFKKASADEKSLSDAAVNSNLALVALSKTDAEKIKYLEILNKRLNNNHADVLASLTALYEKTNKTSKATELMKIADNSKIEGFKDVYYLSLATNHIQINGGSKVSTYVSKVLNSNDEGIKAQSYFILAENELTNKKDASKAEQYALSAENVAPNNAIVLAKIADFYLTLGDVSKSLTYMKKIEKLQANNIQLKLQIAELSILNNEESVAERYYEDIKKLDKEVKNINIASLLYQSQYKEHVEVAEKYAKKAVSSKEKDANLVLALIQARLSKIDAAIASAEKAVKEKSANAEQLLKDLKELKANNKK